MHSRPLMFGYVREELVVSESVAEAELRLRDFAGRAGFRMVRVHAEWEHLTGALWVLANELERMPHRHVIVPSRTHLEAPAVGPRAVLLHRLSSMIPAVQVWSATPGEGGTSLGGPGRRGHRILGDGGGVTVVGSFGCRAVETALPVIRWHVHEDLTRAGLGDLVDSVDAVVRAIVADAIGATRTTAAAAGARSLSMLVDVAFNRMTVWLSVRSDALIVEVFETRDHASDPMPAVIAARGRCGRLRARGGGTITWCAVPLPRNWQRMNRLMRAYHAATTSRGGMW